MQLWEAGFLFVDQGTLDLDGGFSLKSWTLTNAVQAWPLLVFGARRILPGTERDLCEMLPNHTHSMDVTEKPPLCLFGVFGKFEYFVSAFGTSMYSVHQQGPDSTLCFPWRQSVPLFKIAGYWSK